jgi:RNase H-like domain found in reverse transcriptase
MKHVKEMKRPSIHSSVYSRVNRNNTKFDWNDQCQEAFETLKRRFLQEPVLMMPDHSKPLQIESDASKYASGAVLTQTDINGDRHPVAFLSKTFTDTE